ncbi:MAG: hypothetical protein GY928_09190 [Colwellia sp.]|nr:hypothetical protein [Colwellia sp.]
MSITIGNITINRNPNQDEEPFHEVREGQLSQRLEDGSFITFDSGRTVVNGTLVLDQVLQSEADELRAYIKNTIVFQRFNFSIAPPSFYDCGLGDGVEVTNCTLLGGPTTSGIFTPIGRLRRVKIVLRYTFTIQPQSGVVDGEGNIV